MFGWRGCLSLFKNFTAWSFPLLFMVCDKNRFFLILYEKYQMSSCITSKIRNSDTWNRCQSWFGSHPQIREFFSYQIDQSEGSVLLHLNNHNWTHPTLYEIFVLELPSECPRIQQYAISKLLEGWSVSRYCFPRKQGPTDSSLPYSRQKPEPKRMGKII